MCLWIHTTVTTTVWVLLNNWCFGGLGDVNCSWSTLKRTDFLLEKTHRSYWRTISLAVLYIGKDISSSIFSYAKSRTYRSGLGQVNWKQPRLCRRICSIFSVYEGYQSSTANTISPLVRNSLQYPVACTNQLWKHSVFHVIHLLLYRAQVSSQ